MTLSGRAAWALIGVLIALVAVTLPELGSNPWPFKPGSVDPQGPLAPLVRAAGEEWDLGIARACAFLAALLCGGAALTLFRRDSWPAWWGGALALAVAVLLLLPSTLLSAGLRDATEQWFFTNDSTYQIELGADTLLDGDNPYGHDYRGSGLERFYSFDGSVEAEVLERERALDHYAYFPGTLVTAAAWRAMPNPFDDYRVFILLCTLATFLAAFAFRAPLGWKLALGAVLAANPIAIRSAWFGQNDAPSLLLLVLAFGLVSRSRYGWAAVSLAGAVLLKQFAIVALPFLALMLLKRGAGREELCRAALIFGAVVALAILPFFLWDPVAFYEDTVKYGAGTYKIVGYGLSAIMVRLGIIEDRDGSYPFVLFAILLWLPLTVWLLWAQRQAREIWLGAAAFSVSILVLLFIGRTFNNYYLVWPLYGAICAALLASGEPRGARDARGAPP